MIDAFPEILSVFPVNVLASTFPLLSRTTTVLATAVILLLYPSNKSAFRLATKVVLATISGEVPVATLLSNLEATTRPTVFKFPPVMLPVTSKLVSVPTEVTLGCAAVVNVPVKKLALTKLAPPTFPALKFPVTATELVVLLNVNPVEALARPSSLNITFVLAPGTVIFPVIFPTTFPIKLLAVTFPVTLRDVNVPTLVTLGCAAVVSVPVKKLALTKLPPLTLPAVIFPVTPNPVKVPTDVTLGCAAVVRVPVKKLAVTKLPPATLPPVMFPVTASDVNVPTDVTLGCAAVVSVPVTLVPLKLPPVMLPVAVITPAVPIFPPVMFPVTASNVNVPTLVILGCAAVVRVPVKKLAVTKLPPLILPAVMLPEMAAAVAVIFPVLTLDEYKFPPIPAPPSMTIAPVVVLVDTVPPGLNVATWKSVPCPPETILVTFPALGVPRTMLPSCV